jgi:transposase-like protein
MKTKSFVSKLNLITKTLFSMTPAQREVVHQSIQALDTEISTDEWIQPLFDVLSQCPHSHSSHLKRWGKSGSIQRYRCKNCLKPLIIRRIQHSLIYVKVIYGKNMHVVWC